MLTLLLSLTHIGNVGWTFKKSINTQILTDEFWNSKWFLNTVWNKENKPALHLTYFIMSNSNCVQFLIVLYSITDTFKLQTIYTWRCKFSICHWLWEGDWLKIQHPILPQPPTFPNPLHLTPSATVHSTNPVCSLDNSTISDTVWLTDRRPILSVVLWFWLSAVLHYSWMVIRLIALHWK